MGRRVVADDVDSTSVVVYGVCVDAVVVDVVGGGVIDACVISVDVVGCVCGDGFANWLC